MDDPAKTKRVLHVKVRVPSPEMITAAAAAMQNALALYQAFGNTKSRLLRNVGDNSVFLQVVEYETDEAFELGFQKLANDPVLQGWRSIFSGSIDIDVYEDVTAGVDL